jgi:hypothetical protein
MKYLVKFMQIGNICLVFDTKNLTNSEVKLGQYPN